MLVYVSATTKESDSLEGDGTFPFFCNFSIKNGNVHQRTHGKLVLSTKIALKHGLCDAGSSLCGGTCFGKLSRACVAISQCFVCFGNKPSGPPHGIPPGTVSVILLTSFSFLRLLAGVCCQSKFGACFLL